MAKRQESSLRFMAATLRTGESSVLRLPWHPEEVISGCHGIWRRDGADRGALRAVTGAILVLGLSFGGTGPAEKKANDKTYALVQEFIARFTDRNGAISCTELLGCDLSTEEGLSRAREGKLTRIVCPGYVRDAVEILDSIISGQSPGR